MAEETISLKYYLRNSNKREALKFLILNSVSFRTL